MRFGVIEDETIEDYHQSPSLSHSKLEWFRYSPELYYKYYVEKSLVHPKPKDQMELGTICHEWISCGFEKFASKYEVLPEDHDGRYKEGIARNKRLETEGKTGIKFKDMQRLKIAHSKCFAVINKLGEIKKEITFRFSCGKSFSVQCRPDIYLINDYSIYDLKTCNDLETFESNFVKLGYFRQAALYSDVIKQVIGLESNPNFTFIAQEMNEPFRCRLYPVSQEVMEIGSNENAQMIIDFKKRIENNDFKEVLEPKVLSLPRWYIQKGELSNG